MIEPFVDKDPCDGCLATERDWSAHECIKRGACWITKPSLFEQIIWANMIMVRDIHDPPIVVTKMVKIDGEEKVGEFVTEQKLSAKGRKIKEVYKVAVNAMRQKRLGDIGLSSVPLERLLFKGENDGRR